MTADDGRPALGIMIAIALGIACWALIGLGAYIAFAHHSTISCQSPGVWLIANSEPDKAMTFTTDAGHTGAIPAGGSTTVTFSGVLLTVHAVWSNSVEHTDTGRGDCTVPTTTTTTTTTTSTSTSTSTTSTTTTTEVPTSTTVTAPSTTQPADSSTSSTVAPPSTMPATVPPTTSGGPSSTTSPPTQTTTTTPPTTCQWNPTDPTVSTCALPATR